MDSNYLCIIRKDRDGTISGLLQELAQEAVVKEIKFDPLITLGDLLSVVAYKAISPYSQDNYAFKQDYMKHPFFFGHEFKGLTQYKEPWNLRSFFVALSQLEKIITNGQQLSMSEFEVLKQFLSLNFTFRIEFQEINPLYEMGYTINPANKKKISRYQYISLNEINDFNFNQVFSKTSCTPYQFIYSCTSIEDIIFSVLHYLTIFKYKFSRCNHCGKYFSTQTLKQKYCKRKSPYPYRKNRKKEYKPLNCEQAVRNIKFTLRRRQENVYQHLNTYYGYEVAEKFRHEYEKIKEVVDKCSSVENLLQLDKFLDKESINANWYQVYPRIPTPHYR